MGVFGGLIMTNRGRNLQVKAQTGVNLTFTRMAIGDGSLGNSSVLELNALKNERKSLNLTKLKASTGGRVLIGAVLSNQDITSGFYFREIGIFATDPDVGEILYCYGNAGSTADYIPAGGGSDLIEKTININVIVGNAANVSATIDESLAFETPQGAQEKANTAETNAKNYTDNQIASIDLSTFATKEELATESQARAAHQAEKASKTAFGHVQVGDGINVVDGVISVAEMTATNVSTTSGSNVQTEIDNLKSSVSNGKLSVRNAITGKGGTVADADGDGIPTHAELATGVQGIITPKTDKFRVHEQVNITAMSNGYIYGDFLDEDGILISGYNNSTGGDYKVVAYDRSGAFKTETGNLGSPIKSISRNLTHYFVTLGYNLYCFLLKTDGSLTTNYVWVVNHTGPLETVKYYDGKVYVAENSNLGRIKVYDAATGAFIKNIDIGTKNFYVPDFLVTDGFIYAMASTSVCYKVDINTGATVWSVTGLSVAGSSALEITETKNYVYYMTSAQEVTQIQKNDGSVIGTKNRKMSYGRMWADSFGNLINYFGTSMAFYGKETIGTNNSGTQSLNSSIGNRIRGRKNFIGFGYFNAIKVMEPMYSI